MKKKAASSAVMTASPTKVERHPQALTEGERAASVGGEITGVGEGEQGRHGAGEARSRIPACQNDERADHQPGATDADQYPPDDQLGQRLAGREAERAGDGKAPSGDDMIMRAPKRSSRYTERNLHHREDEEERARQHADILGAQSRDRNIRLGAITAFDERKNWLRMTSGVTAHRIQRTRRAVASGVGLSCPSGCSDIMLKPTHRSAMCGRHGLIRISTPPALAPACTTVSVFFSIREIAPT